MNRKSRRKELRKFSQEKENYKKKLFQMLYNSSTNDVTRILSSLIKTPQLLSKVKSILFPRTITNICSNKFIYNSNLQDKVLEDIFVFIIKMFANDLNTYISKKYKYNEFLINEEYEEALQTLLEIENEICLSYWSCCQKMMLTEIVYGLEEHKKIMSNYLNNSGSNLIFKTLIELKSFFVEKNTSYLTYQNKIRDFLDTIKDQDVAFLYFDSKLNLEFVDIEKSRNIVMQLDAQISIIDMYESYLNSNNLNFEDIKELNNSIIDYRLKNKIILSDYNLLKIENGNNIQYYKMIEDYTLGEYNNVIENGNKYIINNPIDFQLRLLILKSYLNTECNDNSKLSGLSKCILSIYKIDNNYSKAVSDLYNYLKIFTGNIWERKIRGFISRKVTFKIVEEHVSLSIVDDYLPMPNVATKISNRNNAEKYLDTFKEVCPITTELYNQITTSKQEKIFSQIKDPLRKNIFFADYLIMNNEYEEACIILKELKGKNKEQDIYNNEKINKRLVKVYLKTRKHLELTRLIVSLYLKNENFIRFINLKEITSVIKRTRDEEVTKDISNVILSYINNSNDYKSQRIAYSNYMNHNNYNSLDDLLLNRYVTPELIFFLEKICTVHLLRRDIILNPTFNKTDEIRVRILWKLIEIDGRRKKIFYEEISNIAKQRSMKDRIKQINESRIFVDVENIKKENNTYLIENFNRYLNVKDFNEDIISIDISSNEFVEDLRKAVTEMNEKIKANASFSQKILILKSIISKITEEFLFNEKYGLNTFLSSRIRHGYCKSQLISVFVDNNLLSKKEQNESEEYNINEYWDAILPPNMEESNNIKTHLSEFTRNIEIVIEEIRSKWLCIKYKEENDAFLDYSNCVSNCLIIERDNIIDYDTFFQEVIEYLWSYTERNFQVLRKRIETELLVSFFESLTKLERNVSDVNNREIDIYVKQICAAINKCKSQIQAKVSEFSNVFYKRDVYYMDFHMCDLVDACIEISGKLRGDFSSIILSKDITDTNKYKGEVFPYFVDIINILINNAVEHCGFVDISNLKLDINIKREYDFKLIGYIKDELINKGHKINQEKFVTISITNNVSKEVDTKKVKERIGNVFVEVKNEKSLKKYTQSEGGTGIYKLYKTLQYNISSPYSILYEVSDYKVCSKIVFGIDRIIESEV